MRHGKAARKLGRVRKQRKALLWSLVVALIDRGRITTTEAKAKEVRPVVEKAITRGKSQSIAARRILSSKFPQATVSKIIKEVAPKYSDVPGGYTRITKLPPRMSDSARMAVIELRSFEQPVAKG